MGYQQPRAGQSYRPYGAMSPDNLQFYSGGGYEGGGGLYSRGMVSGTTTPMQTYSHDEGLPVGGRAGWMRAMSTGSYPGEPPLLEGIPHSLML